MRRRARAAHRGYSTLLVAPPTGLSPNDDWGQLGKQRVVSGNRRAQLDELPPPTVVDLERTASVIPGQYTEVLLRSEFGCRIDQIGDRFWETLVDKVPELGVLLNGKEKLDRVLYEDRFVKSPFLVLALADVLKSLGTRSGGTSSSTGIKLLTSPSGGERYPRTIKDDFMTQKQQEEALAAALDGACDIDISSKGRQHQRELRLAWGSGRRAVVRLDHGFGFLRPQGSKMVDFKEDGATIIRRLNPAQLKAEPAATGIVYVSVS